MSSILDTELDYTVTCRICDKDYLIPMNARQYFEFEHDKRNRRPIQEIFPELDSAQRELLISATCGACWAEMFPEPEEE